MKSIIIRTASFTVLSTVLIATGAYVTIETGLLQPLSTPATTIANANAQQPSAAEVVASAPPTGDISAQPDVSNNQLAPEYTAALEQRLSLLERQLSILTESVQSLSDSLDRETLAGMNNNASASNPDEAAADEKHAEHTRVVTSTITAAEPDPQTADHVRTQVSRAYEQMSGTFDIQSLDCTTAGCILNGFQREDLNPDPTAIPTMDVELTLLTFGGWNGTTTSTTNIETGEVTVYMTR